MDLHGIASGYIGAVNPFVLGTIRVSTGSTTGEDGKQVPSYVDVAGVPLQVQALTYKDIQQVDSLNLNGTRRAIYVRGRVDGLVRAENKGGDLIILPVGQFWGEVDTNTLTVDAVLSGAVSLNDTVSGAGVTDAQVTALGSGSGGVGTYIISGSPQTVAEQQMFSSQVWLVAMVLEQWPNWCKVAVTLQNRS